MVILLSLLLLALVAALAVDVPVSRVLESRRRKEFLRELQDLRWAREADEREDYRRRLTATKERLRAVVQQAVGSTFDEHFARKRRKDYEREFARARLLNHPPTYAMAASAFSTRDVLVFDGRKWRGDWVLQPGAVWSVEDPRQVQVIPEGSYRRIWAAHDRAEAAALKGEMERELLFGGRR